MKNNIKLLLLLIVTVLFSCSDDDSGPIYNVSNNSIELTSNTTSIEMDISNADEVVLDLSWTLSIQEGVILEKYQILFDNQEDEFSNPYRKDVALNLSYALTGSELNSIILDKLSNEVDTPITLNVKVIAIAGEAEIAMSNVISISTAGYAGFLDLTSPWGLVGSATPNGWNGPDVPFYRDPNNEGWFNCYAYLIDGEIKIRKGNDWAVNYGDDGSGSTLALDGANISVTQGNYLIRFNENTLQYTIEAFSWGVIGDATPGGWDMDTNLEYDPTSNQFRGVMHLTDGEIKFRMNDDWATNLGGSAGSLEPGGSNIAVTEGNYIVTLNLAGVDLSESTYTLEAIDHIWGLVGSATVNGWDGPDMKMNLDYTNPDYTKWYLNGVNLAEGEFKFRGDNDWNYNYGDNDGNGTLVEGGGNISVAAGSYNITLDLATSTYEIVGL